MIVGQNVLNNPQNENIDFKISRKNECALKKTNFKLSNYMWGIAPHVAPRVYNVI